MRKFTIRLQSHGNWWFLCRVNSVIGIGVGAGAYILTRFAVSPHQDQSICTVNPLYFSVVILRPSLFCPPLCLACNNWRFSGQLVTLSIKASHQAHAGHQVALQRLQCCICCHYPDDESSWQFSSFQLLSSCFHTQHSGAEISVYNGAERAKSEREEWGSTERWIMKREDSWLGVKREAVGIRNCNTGLSVETLLLFRMNKEKLIFKCICFNRLGTKCVYPRFIAAALHLHCAESSICSIPLSIGRDRSWISPDILFLTSGNSKATALNLDAQHCTFIIYVLI